MAGDTAAVPHLAPVAPAPRPEDQVGDLLRCAREKAGKSMRDVSDALNIRFVYVEALEQSDYGKLPGTTYAIGFLRTYAQYLGLDVAELVQRFKEEQAGLDRQTQLVFPTPVPEGKVPGGALILVSVVLVALAYGAWSYFSKDENSVADLVPAVPERLQNLMTEGDSDGDAPADSATASAGESVAAVPSNSSPIFVLPEPHSDSEIKTAEPVEAAAAMPAPESVEAVPETAVQLVAAPAGSDIGPEPAEASTEAPVEDLVEATLAPAPPAEQETSQPEVVSAPEPVAAPAETSVETPVETSAETPVETPMETSVVAEALPEPEEVAPPPEPESQAVDSEPQPSVTVSEAEPIAVPAPQPVAETTSIPEAPQVAAIPSASDAEPGGQPVEDLAPRVYGVGNTGARIVLRATQEAWVQVRDSDDNLLLTRLLRAGDSYRVPNRPGLTMLTGNAGGLEITVDGNRLGSLGSVGKVRRDVPLDPARLIKNYNLPQ
jgi:cytoskeletal protein RodZ